MCIRDRRLRYTEAGPLPQPQESTFSSADEKFLNRLNKLISENLDNPQLGVSFLCTELGISRAGLYNKLKALAGMGSNDYITKLRIERATWLLNHTSLSINEIADQTGFSTARYFSTVFKQYMGCSPTQYKEERSWRIGSRGETVCFATGNRLFHALKQFVSRCETLCFKQWNKLFQGMKQTGLTIPA